MTAESAPAQRKAAAEKTARKIPKPEVIKATESSKAKAEKKSGVSFVQKKNSKEKTAKFTAVAAKTKSRSAKIAPAVFDKKSDGEKKFVPTIIVRKSKQNLKKSTPVVAIAAAAKSKTGTVKTVRQKES